MLNTTKSFPLILITRHIFTTNINNGLGKTMQKIMKHPQKKKPFYEEQPALPHTNSFGKDMLTSKHKGNKRRMNVLNKLFMRHITDLMATSEMSSTYAGLGLEVNRVEVTPDYNGVNVFWIAKTSPKERDIEEMLAKTSRELRAELTRLRVIGTVPKIYFIRDKQYAEIIEIDNRLAKADFGEDYEPLEVIQRLKTQLIINTPLQPKLKEQIHKLEESFPGELQEDIPDMPQDVLGLNHKDIMDRIKASVKKSYSKLKVESPDNLNLEKSVNMQPVEYKSAKMQREAFKQFLTERQILRRKMRKAESKRRLDIEYFEDEYNELREREVELLTPLVFEDIDYIEEDVEDSEISDK